MGVISGIGWGVGYFGGIASLLLVKALVTADPAQDVELYVSQNQTAMGATGLFFLVAALPTFLLVKNRTKPAPGFEQASTGQLFSEGVQRLKKHHHRRQRAWCLFLNFSVFSFLLCRHVRMHQLPLVYSQKLNSSYQPANSLCSSGYSTFCSAVGALLFGFMDTRFGPRFTVLTTIYIWILGSLLMAGLDPIANLLGTDPKTVFQFTGFILGLGVGSMQSSSRAVVGFNARRKICRDVWFSGEHFQELQPYWV